jgi:hypothetical protein
MEGALRDKEIRVAADRRYMNRLVKVASFVPSKLPTGHEHRSWPGNGFAGALFTRPLPPGEPPPWPRR